MKYEKKIELVPVWQKAALSLEEATAYSGLGRNLLIKLADDPNLNLALWVGRKRLYKRKKLEEYIDTVYSV